MKKQLTFLLFLAGALFFSLPLATKAELTSDCAVVSSDPLDVVTEFTPPSNPDKQDMVEKVVGYNYTVATAAATYDIACTVTSDVDLLSAPFVMAAGFKIDHDSFSVTPSSATEYVYNISGVSGTFYVPDNTPTEPNQQFVIVFVATSADPTPGNTDQQGPPAAMGGGYISTTVQNFRLSPPTDPDKPGMGVSLTGPAGVSGFFKMYMPPSMLTLMSTMSGRTIAVKNLAVFIDDSQASLKISETDNGGALMNIDVTFSADYTKTTANILSSNVTKAILAKEKLPLSLAIYKSNVNNNKTAQLYGWLKNGKAKKSLKVVYKKKGGKKYNTLTTIKTKKDGYYSYKFKPKKMGLKKGQYVFKVKYGKKIVSPGKPLKVK